MEVLGCFSVLRLSPATAALQELQVNIYIFVFEKGSMAQLL